MKFSILNTLKWAYEALRSACLYTVIVSFLYLILVSMEGWVETPALPIESLLIIFGIFLLVSVASLLFRIPRLPKFVSYVIHYAALLIGILVIFIFSDKLSFTQTQGAIFGYVIIFTVIYVLIAVAAFFLRKLLKVTASAASDEGKSSQSEEKDGYESIL